MRRAAFLWRIGPVVAISLALAGCLETRAYDRGRVSNAHIVKVETVIDPETGNVTLLTHWEYDDGLTVTTEDRFKKDTPIEQRRATSRAPVRVVEIP